MVVVYSLTSELRMKLKSPIGTLIRGNFSETMQKFKDIVTNEKPRVIISVGDTVLRNLVKNKVPLKISIIDNKCMRKKVHPTYFPVEKTIYVKNPQGSITEEAILAIQDAMKINGHVKIVVDGEEDLLALIAIFYAPEDSLVVYGQPYEGIVVVKVTSKKKTEVAEILNAMKIR